MVRYDGTYTIYKIQHQQISDGRWVYSIWGQPKTNSKAGDHFTASGNCWQQTGEHGVYDIRNGRVGLKRAIKEMQADQKKDKRPFLKMRLVKVEITQKTIPVK